MNTERQTGNITKSTYVFVSAVVLSPGTGPAGACS